MFFFKFLVNRHHVNQSILPSNSAHCIEIHRENMTNCRHVDIEMIETSFDSAIFVQPEQWPTIAC